MLATLLMVFHEVIEAGRIVGIVLAAPKGAPGRSFFVNYGNPSDTKYGDETGCRSNSGSSWGSMT